MTNRELDRLVAEQVMGWAWHEADNCYHAWSLRRQAVVAIPASWSPTSVDDDLDALMRAIGWPTGRSASQEGRDLCVKALAAD